MNISFLPGRLCGRAAAPASKSEAHRRMICAGLSQGETTLEGFVLSGDLSATMSSLRALGVHAQAEGRRLRLAGGGKPRDRVPRLECGESGSTLRFFVPLALALAGGGIFVMRGRLSQRPMDIYRDLFVPRGVDWHMAVGIDGAAELHVRGVLQPGSYSLPGNVSSQFISGMLFALPLLAGDSELSVTGEVASGAYIQMTLQALRASGIQLEETGPWQWRIPGGQTYHAESGALSGDWTQAAVLLSAGALGGDVVLDGLDPQDLQGDRAIVDYLRDMGAGVAWENGAVRATGGRLRGISADIRDCPDLGPILALVCQLAEGESRITGCARLRQKESDRLEATVRMLNDLGGDARVDGDALLIRGVPCLRGGAVDTHRDHRMVMVASIAALRSEHAVTLAGAEALNKSWPDYLDVYRQLGGQAQ